MTRTELAREISEEYNVSFEKALRSIDAAMDEEFGTEKNEIPSEMAQDIKDGFAEEAEY